MARIGRDGISRERRGGPGWLFGLALLAVALPAAGMSGPKGIDVSHHSGDVDWKKVKESGYHFGYAKATEGVDLVDPRFADHWREMAEAGIARGAYHFYVTEDDPIVQADFFLNTVHYRTGDLVPVVDIEVIGHGTQPGLEDRLLRFLRAVEEEIGVKPILYTSPNFANAHLGDKFGDYDLWVAEYGVEMPVLPNGWDRWTLWQWAGDQKVDGVEKEADVSSFNHPHVSLETLTIPPRDAPVSKGREY